MVPLLKVSPPVRHHRGQFWRNLRTSIEASVIVSQPRDVCDSSTKPTQQPASSRQALHPLRGATPVAGRYTRYVTLHPLRHAAPNQKRCNARGSGAPPLDTSVTAGSCGRNTTQASKRQSLFLSRATCVTQARSRRSNRLHPGKRYTRYGALHPLRGATPDQKRCNAHGSGAPPLPTNSFTATRSRHTPSDGHTATAGSRRRTGFIPACATPVTGRYTHPLRHATPVTGRYTRYVTLHPIRRGAMLTDRVQRHSGPVPSRPRNPGGPPEALEMPSL